MGIYSKFGDETNNTLEGSSKGINYLAGRDGEDTYIIKNLNDTVTFIDDSVISAREDDDSNAYWKKYLGNNPAFTPIENGTNNGNDTLQVNNIKANDLLLFFDVYNKNGTNADSDNIEIKDSLYIFKKSAINSVKSQLEKAFSGKMPSNGVVRIDAFFSDKVSSSSDDSSEISYAENRIENIKTYQNGVEKVIDSEKYFKETQSKVQAVLEKYGYSLASEMLMKANTKQRNELLNCYKTPMDITITGSENDDKIYAEAGNNTIVFDENSGNDIVYNTNSSDKLVFKNTNVSSFYKLGNDLFIYYGDSKYVVLKDYYKSKPENRLDVFTDGSVEEEQHIKDQTTLVEGVGKIYGTEYNDYIEGSTKSDIIYGNGGNDEIYGFLGNDVIYSQSQVGDTVLIAGEEGNDKLYAGAGKDIFYFGEAYGDNHGKGAGEGKDIIYNANSDDKLLFKDIKFEDLKFTKSGNSLVITIPDAKNLENEDARIVYNNFQATLYDYFKSNDKLDELTFLNLNPTTYDTSETNNSIKNAKIYVSGNGKVYGTDFDDIINTGRGNDSIITGVGNDTVTAGKGNDTITLGAGEKTLNFANGDGNDIVYIGEDTTSVKLNFTDVTDYNPLTYSKKGNDLVINRFYPNKKGGLTSGGTVTIKDYFDKNDDIKYKNISILKEDSIDVDLVTIIENNLEIASFYDKKQRANVFSGSNLNDIIEGTKGNDVITSGDGNDVITAGKGNDTIYVQKTGNKTLVFNNGDGNDTVYIENGNESITYFVFNDVKNLDDLIYTKKGNDLVINHLYPNKKGVLVSGGTVTVKDYFDEKGNFSSTRTYLKIDGTGNINLKDEVGDNLNIAGVYDKQHRTTDFTGTEYNDIITGTKGNDIINTGKGDDTINAGAGNDVINAGAGDDIINAGDGNDVINSGSGNDTVTAGRGNDTITLGTGEKTLNFNYGDGNDIVYIDKNVDSVNLVFKDIKSLINKDALTYTKNGNDLIITHFNTKGKLGGTVTIKDYFNEETTESNYKNQILISDCDTPSNSDDISELIKYSLNIAGTYDRKTRTTNFDGSDFDENIIGTNGNDIITTGSSGVNTTGFDRIFAGKGNDTIHINGTGEKNLEFHKGDGNDTVIIDDNLDLKNIKLSFTDLKDSGSLSYTKKGDNLVITHNYNNRGKLVSGGTVTIQDYFNKSYNDKDNSILISKDGITYDNLYDKISESGLNITGVKEYYENDYNGKKVYYTDYAGTEHNDVLTHNSGMAEMEGGKGDDTYNVNNLNKSGVLINDNGDGNDTLNINERKENLALFFSVKSDGTIYTNSDNPENDQTYQELYIFNKNTLNNKNIQNFVKNGNINGVIEIYNYFNDSETSSENIYEKNSTGYIETINTKDKKGAYESIDMDSWIKQVAGEVANWLNDKGYTSTVDVMNSQNSTDINALLKVYQTGSYRG